MSNERGSNLIPAYASEVPGQLASDYRELTIRAEELIEAAVALPDIINDDAQLELTSSHVIGLRDLSKRAESNRVAEKAPWLYGGNAVDAFFFKMIEQVNLTKRKLDARVNDYQQRRLAEERRRREEEARKAREREEEARREREAAARAQRAAEKAAAEAKRPETIERHETQAEEYAGLEADARIDEQIAAAKAEEAELATMESAAQIVGHRFQHGERGGKVTMRRTPVVTIEDRDALDKDALWPFLKEEEILRALKLWARATNHAKLMRGARIEIRDTSVIK